MVEINLFLFVITHECAVIVKNNSAFERLTREFIYEYHFQKISKVNFGQIETQKKHDSLKIDLFLINKRLNRYAFKIFVYLRITSKTYNMVSSVNLFLLFLFKKLFFIFEFFFT